MKHFNKTMWNSKIYIISFSCNVERQLRLPGYIGKNFDFTQTWRYNIKLHDPDDRKWDSLGTSVIVMTIF